MERYNFQSDFGKITNVEAISAKKNKSFSLFYFYFVIMFVESYLNEQHQITINL